ncbi:hypothetical protein MPER_10786 [Moniliophthora perniciosa FA553]|nr:hypothetical protein MPER_10786 [Moniliophthora perniciosa FA553]
MPNASCNNGVEYKAGRSFSCHVTLCKKNKGHLWAARAQSLAEAAARNQEIVGTMEEEVSGEEAARNQEMGTMEEEVDIEPGEHDPEVQEAFAPEVQMQSLFTNTQVGTRAASISSQYSSEDRS